MAYGVGTQTVRPIHFHAPNRPTSLVARRGVPSAIRKFDSSSKWLVTAGATAAVITRRDFLSPYITLGGIAASFLTKRIKLLVKQQRPEGSPFDDPGMPSSHALVATFMAVGWALEVQSRAMSAFLLCAAALVSVLRVVCGHHTWAQVIVGALMGIAMSFAWMALGAAMKKRSPTLQSLCERSTSSSSTRQSSTSLRRMLWTGLWQ